MRSMKATVQYKSRIDGCWKKKSCPNVFTWAVGGDPHLKGYYIALRSVNEWIQWNGEGAHVEEFVDPVNICLYQNQEATGKPDFTFSRGRSYH